MLNKFFFDKFSKMILLLHNAPFHNVTAIDGPPALSSWLSSAGRDFVLLCIPITKESNFWNFYLIETFWYSTVIEVEWVTRSTTPSWVFQSIVFAQILWPQLSCVCVYLRGNIELGWSLCLSKSNVSNLYRVKDRGFYEHQEIRQNIWSK